MLLLPPRARFSSCSPLRWAATRRAYLPCSIPFRIEMQWITISLAGVRRRLYNRCSVGGRFNTKSSGWEVRHDRKADRLLDAFPQIGQGANRGNAGHAKGAA